MTVLLTKKMKPIIIIKAMPEKVRLIALIKGVLQMNLRGYIFFITLSMLLGVSSISYAAATATTKTTATKRRIINLVDWATKRVQEVGRIRAVCQFNEYNLTLKKGEPAIFAYVCSDGENDGFILADSDQHLIFTKMAQIASYRKFREALTLHPHGAWVTNKVSYLKAGQMQAKHSFVRQLSKDKLCVGASYYS